jgi:hypothetical protein
VRSAHFGSVVSESTSCPFTSLMARS